MCGNTHTRGQGTPCRVTGHHSVEITTKKSIEALEEVAEFTQKGFKFAKWI